MPRHSALLLSIVILLAVSASVAQEKPAAPTSIETKTQFLYAPWNAPPELAGELLSPLSGLGYPIPGSPFFCYGCYTPGVMEFVTQMDNRFILAQNRSTSPPGGENVVEFGVDDETGSLTQLAGIDLSANNFVEISGLVTDPLGRFFYITAANCSVMVYSLDPHSGELTAMSPTAPPCYPQAEGTVAGAADPSGSFLYALSWDGDISGYQINRETGVLTPVPGSPFNAGSGFDVFGNFIIVDARGHFLYAANLAENDVWGFSIDAETGALSQLEGSPYRIDPGLLALQKQSNFLYIADEQGISAYAIQSDGSLLSVLGSPFPAGSIWSLLVNENGTYLYASSVASPSGFSTITPYRIDRRTGALRLSPLSSIQEMPGDIFTLISTSSQQSP